MKTQEATTLVPALGTEGLAAEERQLAATRRRANSVMATGHDRPTVCSCRRSSTRSASRSTGPVPKMMASSEMHAARSLRHRAAVEAGGGGTGTGLRPRQRAALRHEASRLRRLHGGGRAAARLCRQRGRAAGLRETGAFRQASFYDTASGERLARRRLFRRMTSAQIVLMGEVHDNVQQHRIRGSLLLDWVRHDPARLSALVFEHLDREHDDELRLAQRRQDSRPSLEDLLDAGHFDRKGWQWPAHQPLLEAAHASGATWIAANFSRASARRLARAPDAEVEPLLQAIVQSARWSEEAQQALDLALMQGHCGQLPPAALPGIARIQRLRDAALAQPLLDAAERRSMLLAGNGHVRRDYGVPRYLLALEREALVIGFEEAAGEPAEAQGEGGGCAAAGGRGRRRAGGGLRSRLPPRLPDPGGRSGRSVRKPRAGQSEQRRAKSSALNGCKSSAPSPTPMKYTGIGRCAGDRGEDAALGGAVELGERPGR